MDLISKLPDEILHRIISMISFKEAIQTITLSTSWRSLISTSHMIINHTSIQSSCHEYSKQTLKPILESNQAFQILKLYCSLCDQLLAVGTKGAHNELHLDFSGQKKLNPCKFNMILSQSSLTACPKFSSLKILHLRSVSQLGGNLVNDLFSSCQLLESLKLEKCPGLEDLEIKSNGCLRKFEMLDCSNVVRVVIYAQKLESFSYGGFFAVIEIIESPNLVDVTLDFREGLGKTTFDCEDALSLLSNVQDVEILTVNSWLLEALCCAGVIFNKLDFQFSKLKNLLCICSKISSQMRDSLACFLNATPSLEELLVKVDNRDSTEPKITPEQAVKLCDRNFGIGADGVIFAMPGTNGTDYTMRIFNSDGSEPEMCGNGVRCFARFIAELENLNGKQSFTVHTGAGLIVPEIQEDGKVKVDMGEPILKASEVPTKLPPNKDQSAVKARLDVDGLTWNVTCVSMGNPHCVTFGSESNKNLQVDELNLAEIGPKFEHHAMFPARTNTEFVQVFSPSHLKMRVWERGAGATLACGTGACAVVVAAVLEGRADRSCTVDLPGGPLDIEWREEDNHIYMTGPAEVVFYGSVPI